MGGSNGYAALVKQRTAKGSTTKRRKLDDYETPPEPTGSLLRFVKFRGPILEPAAGSGRMARDLSRVGGFKTIKCVDIKDGPAGDFLKRTRIWPGDIISNPPYRDGLAERFARHALKLADGRVALLMQNGFLWGGKRAAGLFADAKPEALIIHADRIYFFEGGAKDAKQIPAQFFSHVWVIWPDRKTRAKPASYKTLTYWASDDDF